MALVICLVGFGSLALVGLLVGLHRAFPVDEFDGEIWGREEDYPF